MADTLGEDHERTACLAIADGYDRLADLIDNRNRQGQSPAPKVPSTLKGAATLPSRAPPASGSAIAVALGSTGAGRKARPSIRAKNGSCRGGSIPHPATKRRASTSQKTTTEGDRFTCLSGQTPTSVGLAPPSRRDKSGTGFARRFVTLNASTTCRQLYYRFVMRPTMTAAYWLRRAADTRSEADAAHDQEARRVKVILAEGFERLAKHTAHLADADAESNC